MTGWLADTSALIRLHSSPHTDEWVIRCHRGLVHISTVTRLEVGFSARSADDHRRSLQQVPIADMPVAYLRPAMEDRAVEVQLLLAERGHHRTPSVADLLLAATAEFEGLTILYVDKHFELIAEVTGQPVERLSVESATRAP